MSKDFRNITPDELESHYRNIIAQTPKEQFFSLILSLEKDKQHLFQLIYQEIDEQYKYIGLNEEGAMDWLEIYRSVFIFYKLSQAYEKRFVAEGKTDKILDSMVTFILEQYKLPVDDRKFRADDPSEIRILKGALRCLLDIAENTSYPNFLHPEAPLVYGAGVSFSAREMLAFRWLAATDPELTSNQQMDEKMNILYYLADIRRAHNGEEAAHSLDDPIDDTSCAPGVIGRMGHMHVHNPLTSIDEITPNATHFSSRYLVFLINTFRNLPAIEQMNIINGWYHQAATLEESKTFSNFIDSLQQKDRLQNFVELLKSEFGDLDDLNYKMAILTFFHEAIKNQTSMQSTLLERLDAIAKQSILQYLKSNPKLIDLPEISQNYARLKTILKKIRHSLSLAQLEAYIAEEQELMEQTEKIAKDFFQNELAQQENEYKLNKGNAEFIASENIDPLPFWYQKLQLNLEEADYHAKCAFADPSMLPQFKNAKKPLLTANEQGRVRDYLMLHARHPEKLGLTGYLHPNSLVQFGFLDKGQVRVYFIDIFHHDKTIHCDFSIEKVKSFALTQQALEEELAHPADILLQHFSVLKNLGDRGEIFRELYLKQLQEAKFNNIELYNCAIAFQDTDDLAALSELFDVISPASTPSTNPEELRENLQDQLDKVYQRKFSIC